MPSSGPALGAALASQRRSRNRSLLLQLADLLPGATQRIEEDELGVLAQLRAQRLDAARGLAEADGQAANLDLAVDLVTVDP